MSLPEAAGGEAADHLALDEEDEGEDGEVMSRAAAETAPQLYSSKENR